MEKTIKKVHDTSDNIMEMERKVRELTSKLLDRISTPKDISYDISIFTGVKEKIEYKEYDVSASTGIEKRTDYEEYYPYYLCYQEGIFSLKQDQDPKNAELNVVEVNPFTIKGDDLVEIIYHIPNLLKNMLEIMEKEKRI